MELTQTGQRAYASAMDRQRRGAADLARGIDPDEIRNARDLMTTRLARRDARAAADRPEPENPTEKTTCSTSHSSTTGSGS